MVPSLELTKTSLFETSFVINPANMDATVERVFKKAYESGKESDINLAKFVLWGKEAKPKLKAYREAFMAEEIFEKLGLKKSGDEILDIKSVCDIILSMKSKDDASDQGEEKETPAPQETPEPQKLSKSDLSNLYDNI